jgi:hypothetical protein
LFLLLWHTKLLYGNRALVVRLIAAVVASPGPGIAAVIAPTVRPIADVAASTGLDTAGMLLSYLISDV